MGIKVSGTQEVKTYLQVETQKMVKAFIGRVDMIAKDVVTAIRTGDASFWNDQTGNLRSSIGYLIVQDGKQLTSDFQVYNGRGEEGMQNGMTFAQTIAAQYPRGIAVIFVAGMEYAAYVEAIESRVVLAGGELLAEKLFKRLDAEWKARFGK